MNRKLLLVSFIMTLLVQNAIAQARVVRAQNLSLAKDSYIFVETIDDTAFRNQIIQALEVIQA